MITNYIVNYGVDSRHLYECKGFTLYRDASDFYENIDRLKWGAANIVKIDDGECGRFSTAKVSIKKEYCVR